MPGIPATPRGIEHRATVSRQLAALIGALRDADPGERRFSGSGRGGRLADHDDWVSECLQRSEHLLPVDRLRRMWDRARSLPREDADVLCHGDLIPANLLVDGADGADGTDGADGADVTGTASRLVGVLDTGGFGPADPALDLVVAWHLLDAERRAVLREQLRASDLQWARGAAWALEQALGLVWYYERTLPAMADLGRTTLGRLLEDPVLA
ncbi:phosphotransferase [Brachybacterium sp. NPDC056505]|uniref:phosphotransferase n=1 Tax=Brachybacterium sp. NPDC056505 TaxID=3345843 RepID=UPI00366B6891